MAVSKHLLGLFGAGVLLCSTLEANPIPVVEVGSSTPVQASRTAAVSSAAVPQADAVTRLLQQLEAMQRELAEVRGQMEEQRHQLEQLKAQQKDRYLDLDRRLSALAQPPASASVAAPAAATGPAAASTPATPVAGEQEAYQAAFALIRQRQFDQAISALDQFLKQYPNSELAANARYWQGEVFLAEANYAGAKAAFEQVLADYPGNSKLSDASYKLGRTLIQMGDNKGGKARLQLTLKTYPDSSAARLAAEYLKGLD